jgi:hypothetical protein
MPAGLAVKPPAETYYAVLGVAPTATPAEIEAAWRALMKRHHPDTAYTRADRAMKTKAAARINAAHTVLRDPAKRATYDLDLRGPRPKRGPAQPAPAPSAGAPAATAAPQPAPAPVAAPPPRQPFVLRRGSLGYVGYVRDTRGVPAALRHFFVYATAGQWLTLWAVIFGALLVLPLPWPPLVALAWLPAGALLSRSYRGSPLSSFVGIGRGLARLR